MMTLKNCNDVQHLSQYVKINADSITLNGLALNELETSIMSSLNIKEKISSLRVYRNSVGDNFLFYLLIKTHHIQRFCDVDCNHLTNDCVSAEFLNLCVLTTPEDWHAFFEKQSDHVKRHAVSMLSPETILKLSLQVLEILKPYLFYTKLNDIVWQLLQQFRRNAASEAALGNRNELTNPIVEKLLFFIEFIDDYGQHINILETFFDPPAIPSDPAELHLNVEERFDNLNKCWRFLQSQRLRAENYKTIIDLATDSLQKNNTLLIALKTRLGHIKAFRVATSKLLHHWILPDLANIIFNFALPSQNVVRLRCPRVMPSVYMEQNK